jgi:hypothetical protein
LSCQANELFSQCRQDLVDAQWTAIDLEREPNEREARSVRMPADLVATRELPIGLDDLLDDDRDVDGEVGAKGPAELVSAPVEIPFEGMASTWVGNKDLYWNAPVFLAKGVSTLAELPGERRACLVQQVDESSSSAVSPLRHQSS